MLRNIPNKVDQVYIFGGSIGSTLADTCREAHAKGIC